MSNPTALSVTQALAAWVSDTPASAPVVIGSPVPVNDIVAGADSGSAQADRDLSAAELQVIADLSHLRHSKVRSREQMLTQLRAHHFETKQGFAFVALCSDGVLVPIADDHADLDAFTRARLARVRVERLDTPAVAARVLATTNADWAHGLLATVLPALTIEQFSAWARPGQDSMVGFVSADGSIIAWADRRRVIRPSLAMSRSCGIGAL